MGISPQQFAEMQARVAKNAKRKPAAVPVIPKVISPEARLSMTKLALRPSEAVEQLNKTEAEFLVKLRADKWPWIGVQAMKLRLASNKCTYTPDFITVDDGVIVAWEVKGFWRDDARVKIKVAAKEYPFIRFVAVTKTKSGWKEEDFSP